MLLMPGKLKKIELGLSASKSKFGVQLSIEKKAGLDEFNILASSQYIHLEVPSSMDAESVRKALCILRSDIHTEMYQQFDCRYAPDSLANVGFVAEDCDLAAQLVSSTIEDLFGAETALA